MRILYTIKYTNKIFAKMTIAYYAYLSRDLLIEIPAIGLLMFFCYPTSFDPQYLAIFFVVGIMLGGLGRTMTFFLIAMKAGAWEVVRCGDRKVDFTLSDQSVIRESKLAKMEYDWALLFKIVETKSYLFLILLDRGYIPVPKAVLTHEINAWLDSKLIPRKTRRRRKANVPSATTQLKDDGE